MDMYQQFLLEEIKFHTEKINEIITEGMMDPEGYYHRSLTQWRQLLPLLVLAQYVSPQPQDQPQEAEIVGESSQDTPDEDEEVSSSFSLDTSLYQSEPSQPSTPQLFDR